jgi:hypothetical protein
VHHVIGRLLKGLNKKQVYILHNYNYTISFSLQSAISEITKMLDFTVCPKK